MWTLTFCSIRFDIVYIFYEYLCLPNIHMLKPILSGVSVRRWGLWEETRPWGPLPHDWSKRPFKRRSPLLKDGLERSLVPSHRVRIQGQWALCNSFYQNPEYRHPDLGLATSRTVRNRFLWFFNYPYLVFGYSSLNRPRQRCKVHQPRGESHGQTQPQWGGVVHSFQSRGVKGVNICRIISCYE